MPSEVEALKGFEVQRIEDVKDSDISTVVGTADVDYLKAHGGTTKDVRNAELYNALQQSPIQRWSRSSWHLYLAILTAFFSSCANGYDGSLMTSILAMPYFQSEFDTGTKGPKVSLIFSMYTVGAMVAAPLGAPISDKIGRRKTMFIGAIVVIVGMVVAVTSTTVAQFAVSRAILGGGVVIMTVAAPAYCIEVSPPNWRGRATGLYNVGWFGGSIPAAAITFGTNYIQSNRSWQLPLIFQAWACGLVIILVWFIPESPRYLLARGREQEALDFLIKYHGNGDPNSALVALEFQEMREGIALDGADKRWWDYRHFATHSGRWRIAQVVMISIFGQFTGNGLGYFNTVIYSNLGVSSVPKQLAYNLLSSIISCVGAVSGSALTDRMYRRPVLITGTLICSGLLAINAGLSDLLSKQQATTGQISMPAAQGALAAYFLFGVSYSFAYTPLQTVLPAESLENTNRAKGLAICQFLNNAASFINAYAGPIALERLEQNYIWVFVGWDLVEATLWYFFLVEGQGRTLEELAEIYDSPHPVKASLRKEKIVLDEAGRVRAGVVV